VATITPLTSAASDRSPAAVVADLRRTFDDGVTRPLEWRREQLRALDRLLSDGAHDLLHAMAEDMGKPAVEGQLTDLSIVSAEIGVMLRHLTRWARPERMPLPLAQQPGRATVVREPLGVALVIAPWNYPVQLLLVPVAAALAAGNCVVAKPSEISSATAGVLARLIPSYLDPRAVAVVEGGPAQTEALLAERFDTIFYTGSGRVGRIVLQAAARHLTPVTLELGGKSPVIVTADADLETAARRIAWGKFLNAGQTCVAPDYLLVERAVEDRLVDRLRTTVADFYGQDPARSADLTRIVNDQHFQRLTGLLAATSGRVAIGGQTDAATRYVAPTVVTGIGGDDPLMEDELFGPILPVVAVDDLDEAIAFVAARPKPLALYLFSGSAENTERVLQGTSSGGVGVNCTVQHFAVPSLPFGGVGASGFGAYHGRSGFETFSHRRAVLVKPAKPDLPVLYPPYNRLKAWLLKRLL
jgi:aldehyde dehydrogenase (NAD+)